MIDLSTASEVSRTGIGLGTIIAVVLSWDRSKSILWAIFHGLLSWIYVIYFAITDRQHHTGKAILYVILSIVLAHLLIVGFLVTARYFTQ